ncbi:extracellular solute-binding protein [Emiliania huxleyi CCMP1516]|uniref:Solute-binding protein family 3/N-terminal domain-containing protein n=2 Tax=Emiliania huxleyi TaxID=2903 RepID=A0A0D3J5V1_EMIH1|nr:extracellular solute-binding protein [Emiliania huxleyi CCMP1516]EOD18886.1 extracellular solute-binding protein [Emiliania huxleyi CCMP1516]|eukprot:XP_005771315.1 extracellular solute-binding protein [Emiliania huxleyi CCMP1516]
MKGANLADGKTAEFYFRQARATASTNTPSMLAAAKAVLAPRGTVRAAINMSNILLVTNRADPAQPGGVAPDMAAALADALGAKLQLVPYKNPGALADSAGAGEWDVGLIGAEPARAAIIGFSAPYAEIEATYLVRPGVPFHTAAQVDTEGVRVASSRRSAYTLWLEDNLRAAQLVQTEEPGAEGSWDLFQDRELEALAVAFLDSFVADAKSSGLVANLLAKHGVEGKLSVAL